VVVDDWTFVGSEWDREITDEKNEVVQGNGDLKQTARENKNAAKGEGDGIRRPKLFVVGKR
jgi:hypothetical protein